MTIRGHAVTFDCSNAKQLAGFWAAALGQSVGSGASEDFASIGANGDGSGAHFMFVQVPEGKQIKNRVHVDLFTDDLDAEVKRIEKLGAEVQGTFTEGGGWTTMRDPEGNEFDVVASDS